MYQRISHKQLSGEYAHLNGKSISWEENHAYLASDSTWTQVAGKIVSVGQNGRKYFVENRASGARHWIDASWEQYRNIVVVGA